jgi:hypothetical protein
MRVLIALVSGLSMAALAASCASPYKPETVSWGSVDDSTRGTKTEVVADDGPKMTATEFAAKFDSPIDCEYEARTQYKASPKSGLALLSACMNRPDFTVLTVFTEEPWMKLFKDPHRFLHIARVVGNRGGRVGPDLVELQAAQVPIYSVEQALDRPKQTVGRIVLARGLYSGQDKERPELHSYLETTVPLDGEGGLEVAGDGKLPSIGEPVGRVMLVEPKRSDEEAVAESEYIIVGEVLGTETRFAEEDAEDQRALVIKTLLRIKPYAFIR